MCLCTACAPAVCCMLCRYESSALPDTATKRAERHNGRRRHFCRKCSNSDTASNPSCHRPSDSVARDGHRFHKQRFGSEYDEGHGRQPQIAECCKHNTSPLISDAGDASVTSTVHISAAESPADKPRVDASCHHKFNSRIGSGGTAHSRAWRARTSAEGGELHDLGHRTERTHQGSRQCPAVANQQAVQLFDW